VAVESAGKIGSVYSFVDVPDSSREALTLSGPLLSSEDSTPVIGAIARSIPMMPLVHRSFRRNERVRIWVRIHQPAQSRLRPVRVSAVIVSAAGQRIPVHNASFDAAAFAQRHTLDYVHQLSLEDLVAGEYGLELEVAADPTRVIRRLFFAVRDAPAVPGGLAAPLHPF
jgi:hypothetical protein